MNTNKNYNGNFKAFINLTDFDHVKLNEEMHQAINKAKRIMQQDRAVKCIESVTFNTVNKRNAAYEAYAEKVMKDPSLSEEEKMAKIAIRREQVGTENIVTVKLKNGSVGIAKCAEGDTFDEVVGFALAFSRAIFGSNTKFIKALNKFNGKAAKEVAERDRKQKERAAAKLAAYQKKVGVSNKKRKRLAE